MSFSILLLTCALGGLGDASSNELSAAEAVSCAVELAAPGGLSFDPVGGSVELDKTKVRHGNPAKFDPDQGHKVGTVRSTEVYAKIPAYQTIKKESVEKGSARYKQLIKEATAVYTKALGAVAKGGYALIVEEGGIKGYPTADLTSTVIKKVEKA